MDNPPFENSYYMSAEAPKLLIKLIQKSPLANKILCYFFTIFDENNKVVCSITDIEIELTEKTSKIKKALDVLIEMNFIEVEDLENSDIKIFIVNPDIARSKL